MGRRNQKKRIRLSDSDLQSYAAEHFVYELEMLFGTASLFASMPPTPVLKDAVLESFLLHMRSLVSFFYPVSVKPDDVIADDFCGPPNAWRSQRPQQSRVLETALTRAHKELAHLTQGRIAGTPANKIWDLETLSIELKSVTEKFIAIALPQRLDRSAAAKILALLNPPSATNVSTPSSLIAVAGLTHSVVKP